MSFSQLSTDFLIAGQLSAGDVDKAAAMGVRTIICNRPDGEGLLQPASDKIEAAAAAKGMKFAYIPIAPGRMTPDDVAKMRKALAELPKPALAYCRTGMRSATLWALASAGKMKADDIIAAARGAGFNVAPLRPALEHEAARA